MVFSNFFYYLRRNGIKVSVEEWLSLMQALKQDMAKSDLMEFYYISRALLIKKESQYSLYNQLFSSFFQEILMKAEETKEISEKLMEYLLKPIDQLAFDEEEVNSKTNLPYKELMKMFSERLEEQNDLHNGGEKWIGTGGTSPFGNSGYSKKGIRIGAYAENKNAYRMIDESAYKDFREDKTIGSRQFEIAFRRLRQLSQRNEKKTEVDISKTINATCDNGGMLSLQYKSPRKNKIKLLVLFDSGGSMAQYASLCSTLFKAVSQANHFQSLKIFYFHNCPYTYLYETPECVFHKSQETEKVLKNIGKGYKVVFVGDAAMAPWELRYFSGGRSGKVTDTVSGLIWLHKIIAHCENAVWLNPIPEEKWNDVRGKQTIQRIQSEVSMFHLSVRGLENAIQNLLHEK